MPELESLRRRVLLNKIRLHRKTNEIKYKATVKKTEREMAELSAGQFSAELLDFLSQNPSSLLPLQLSLGQRKVIDHLVETAKSGNLQEERVIGVTSGDRSFVTRAYGTGDREKYLHQGDVVESTAFILNGVDANFITRYDLHPQNANAAVIWGKYGIHHMRAEFLTFPQKAESSEQLFGFLGYRPEYPHGKTEIGVYNSGERVIVTEDILKGNKNTTHITQYHFLGSFDGLDTLRTYWLYGSNSDKHETLRDTLVETNPVFSLTYA